MSYTWHGIEFDHSGTCNQCGLCGCEGCSHARFNKKLTRGEPGYVTCTIYKTRAEFCAEHGETHQVCIDFPDHPWAWVVRQGLCSMAVSCVKSEDQTKVDALTIAFDARGDE